MPYSTNTLTSASASDAMSQEMKGYLTTALTSSGKYTRVTTGYVSGTKTFDVWQNDGTTDGYGWYLVVATDTANTSRLFVSACLEYDDATKTAKKALRGYNTAGWVDANGYPLVSSGGAEMTFALGSFAVTTTAGVGNFQGGNGTMATAAVNGGIIRIMVTGQCLFLWWGTTTTVSCACGVGTYQRLHPDTRDAKPLAWYAVYGTAFGGTVWQQPSTADASYSRATGPTGNFGSWTAGSFSYTQLSGTVGGSSDLLYGGPVGSRIHVSRGSTAATATAGYSLGLAPSDLLIFDKAASVQIGDTITVDGKVYMSVGAAATGNGLFINTTPAV